MPIIGTMEKTLYSKEYAVITHWLREQRIGKGITIRALAELLDASHSFVGKVEMGERRLDIVEYVTYCEALGISPDTGIQKLRKL